MTSSTAAPLLPAAGGPRWARGGGGTLFPRTGPAASVVLPRTFGFSCLRWGRQLLCAGETGGGETSPRWEREGGGVQPRAPSLTHLPPGFVLPLEGAETGSLGSSVRSGRGEGLLRGGGAAAGPLPSSASPSPLPCRTGA